jgi:antitoxin PrlF
MATLTVTAKGQVTLRKRLLEHLGVAPGERIEVRELPGGRIEIRAARPPGSMGDFVGILAGKTAKVVTIDEMNESAAEGWAGRR